MALVTNASFEIWFFYQEHKTSLIRIQREQAEAASAKIGQFVEEIEAQLGWTTQLPWIGHAWRSAGSTPGACCAKCRQSQSSHSSIPRASSDSASRGWPLTCSKAEPTSPKTRNFSRPWRTRVYYGPVYFRYESEPYMTLSLAGSRRDAGVSVAEVNLKFIWDVVSQIKVGERGQAYVVDAQGRLIAHPDINLVLRGTDLSDRAQVQAARAASAGTSQEPLQVAEGLEGRQVLTAYAAIAPLGWLVFVELPRDEAYARLYATIERTGLVLLAALGLAVLAGMFLARKMVVPIQALQAGAARIGSGDLGQRISIKTGDELEALADQFNDMAGTAAGLLHRIWNERSKPAPASSRNRSASCARSARSARRSTRRSISRPC